jgi:hypothetical protein
VKLVLLCLLGLHLIQDASPLPTWWSWHGDGPEWLRSVWAGIAYCQPSLLAIWAVFGNEPLVIRLPRAIYLVAVFALAVVWGAKLDRSARLDAYALGEMAAFVSIFLVCLMAFGTVRGCFGWRIVRVPRYDGHESNDRPQLSLLRLLTWVSATAVLFGMGSLLMDQETFTSNSAADWGELVREPLFGGAILGVCSLPILLCMAAVLADEHRLRYTTYASGVALAELAILSAIFNGLSPDELSYAIFTFSPALITFHGAAVLTVWVIRQLGYRLKTH